MLGNATGVGAILYYSMSSFMLPLEEEFGWSRSDMGLAVSCLVVGWIVSMPVVGAICDKFGPRWPILVCIPLLSAVLFYLPYLNGSLTQLYVVFFFAALLGSGTLGVSYIAAVSPAFVANRGLAYGLTLAGTGVSAALLPIGLHQLISQFDWRFAWQVLGVVVLAQWPIAYLCIRPYRTKRSERVLVPLSTQGHTLRQALTSVNFWLLAGAFLFVALLLSGLLINLIPLLTESGMRRDQAAAATAGVGVGLLFARVFVGYLLDRFPARIVAVLSFGIAALGCVMLTGDSPQLAAAGALFLGFTVGSELDLLAYMTARYFGERAHASIYSASLSVFYVGAIIAPLLVGEIYAHSQSYDLVLHAAVGSCAVASVLIGLMGPYPEWNARQITAMETDK